MTGQWVKNVSPSVDRVSIWRSIVGVALASTSFMVIVVGTRFWIRRRRLLVEDWIIAVTALFSALYSTGAIVQTRYGLGLPPPLRPLESYSTYAHWNIGVRPFYFIGIAGFKLSLCVSYLRFTRSKLKPFTYYIIGLVCFTVSSQFIFIMLNLFPCIPYSKVFHPEIDGTCLPSAPVNYTSSVVAITIDIAVSLTPIPLINMLRLDRTVRAGLIFTSCLGLLTTVCSLLRMTQIWRVAYTDGNSSYLVLYGALEVNVGIITSSLPVLRPSMKHAINHACSIFHWRPFSTSSKLGTPPQVDQHIDITDDKQVIQKSVNVVIVSVMSSDDTSCHEKKSTLQTRTIRNVISQHCDPMWSLDLERGAASGRVITNVSESTITSTIDQDRYAGENWSWQSGGVIRTVEICVMTDYEPEAGDSSDSGGTKIITEAL